MYLSNASGIGINSDEVSRVDAVRQSIQRQFTANSKTGFHESNYSQFRRTVGGASSLESKQGVTTSSVNAFTNQKF